MPTWKKVIVSGSSPTLNELTLSGDINLAPTNKIQFDGDGGHTYIDEQSDDNLRFRVGAQNMMIMVEGDTDYVRVPDSVRLSVGSSNDLQMVHDGTNSFLLNNTGDLTISNLDNDKDVILKSDDGSGGTTPYITLDGSATQTLLHQDTVLTGGKKLYIAGNTYITEASSDILDFYVGGVKMYTIDETNNLLTMRGTGGSDGAAGSPTLRLSNTVETADWDTGDVVGALEYYAEDASGNAPYVTSFIKSVNGLDGSNGTLPSGALTFGVASYNLSGGAVEKMRIDSTGNVGIGVSTPEEKMHIFGDAPFLKIENNTEDASGIIMEDAQDPGQNGRIVYDSGANKLYLQAHGGTGFEMDSSRDIKINESLGIGVAANGTTGRLDCSNDVVAFSTSDERLKENIKPLDNALDKVLKISGVSFDWKELTEEEKKTIHGNEGHDIGVIAQEIEEVLPEVVTERDNGYKAVKYEKIVPLLIESIKEQQKQIENLKKEIKELKK
jgi:hypothetical protein